jgi:cell division protein FtsW
VRILAPRLVFIASTVALVVFGLVMVYSASFVEAFTNPDIQDSSYIFRRQLMLVGAGLVALLATVVIDYRVWNDIRIAHRLPLSWLPWAAVLVLLVLTWSMGNEELGGRRWFDLFGINLQPSEFAKVAMLLVVGMLLVRLREAQNVNPVLLMLAAAIGLPTLFILLQPDLGTALIALAGIVAVAWFGELSMKPLVVLGLLVAVVVAAAVLLAGFRMSRIDAWLDPWAYASDAGYQIVNSFYALADGGVTGVGLGLSHQKYLYLPQPHNDLIFPIIGEELGLVGAVVVVVLFLAFLLSAFLVARNAPDLYGRVVAGSAATMIGFQAFLNMLCMVNLLPMTGKPLPFFSAGGSSIIVTLMLAGLVVNVSLRSMVPDAAAARRDELLILESSGARKTQRASSGNGTAALRPSTARKAAPPASLRRPPRPAPASASARKAAASPPARRAPAPAASSAPVASRTSAFRRPPAPAPSRAAPYRRPPVPVPNLSPARSLKAKGARAGAPKAGPPKAAPPVSVGTARAGAPKAVRPKAQGARR